MAKLADVALFLITVLGFHAVELMINGSPLPWNWLRVTGWILVLSPWVTYFFMDIKAAIAKGE